MLIIGTLKLYHYTLIALFIGLFVPILLHAQYSAPQTQGGCNSCETDAAGKDAPHLQTNTNIVVDEQESSTLEIESSSTRFALLNVLLSLLTHLQQLLERLYVTPAVVDNITDQEPKWDGPWHSDCHLLYTYKNCPVHCTKQCVNGSEDFADCDVRGSCYYDPGKDPTR